MPTGLVLHLCIKEINNIKNRTHELFEYAR